MLIASHIAAAPCAATGRFDRPSERLPVGAFGYWVVGGTNMRFEEGSKPKPE